MQNHQISSSQLRAARALLRLSRTDLAKQIHISEQTIHRFENDQVEPEIRTKQKIQQLLEMLGIEFTDFDGVRWRPEGIQIAQGREGLIALMEDVYESCRRGVAGKIVLSGVSEDDFQKYLGDYDEIYLKNMSSLENVQMRCLISEDDYNCVSSAYCKYRWISKDQFNAVPFYAYADKLAIILFSTNPSPKIFIIQSRAIADAYRTQFESMWQHSKKIPQRKASTAP